MRYVKYVMVHQKNQPKPDIESVIKGVIPSDVQKISRGLVGLIERKVYEIHIDAPSDDTARDQAIAICRRYLVDPQTEDFLVIET